MDNAPKPTEDKPAKKRGRPPTAYLEAQTDAAGIWIKARFGDLQETITVVGPDRMQLLQTLSDWGLLRGYRGVE